MIAPYPPDFVQRVKDEYMSATLHAALDCNDFSVGAWLDLESQEFDMDEIDTAIQKNDTKDLHRRLDNLIRKRRLFLEWRDHVNKGRSAS